MVVPAPLHSSPHLTSWVWALKVSCTLTGVRELVGYLTVKSCLPQESSMCHLNSKHHYVIKKKESLFSAPIQGVSLRVAGLHMRWRQEAVGWCQREVLGNHAASGELWSGAPRTICPMAIGAMWNGLGQAGYIKNTRKSSCVNKMPISLDFMKNLTIKKE